MVAETRWSHNQIVPPFFKGDLRGVVHVESRLGGDFQRPPWSPSSFEGGHVLGPRSFFHSFPSKGESPIFIERGAAKRHEKLSCECTCVRSLESGGAHGNG